MHDTIHCISLFISSSAFAQEKPTPSKDVDSTTVGKTKSPSALKVLFSGKPGKALTYSLLLPGAGQVYNKRIWKVPFVYAALGGSIYGIYFNKKNSKDLIMHIIRDWIMAKILMMNLKIS